MNACKRTYRNGKPCTAAVRYEFTRSPFLAPQTCGRHMTPEDRRILDVLATYRPHGPEIPWCMRWDPPMEQGTSEALARWQAGRCAICGVEPERLLLDHCHKTGLIRGYLCGRCNSAEGHDSDATGVLDAYRYRPPAVIVGWTAPYRDLVAGRQGPMPGVVRHLGPIPSDTAAAVSYLQQSWELELAWEELHGVSPEAIAELTSLLAPGNSRR